MNRRDLFKGAFGAVTVAATIDKTAAATAETPWYERVAVGIEIGPTGANDKDAVYMAEARGSQWVNALVEARAQYGVLFMKDQNFAYYNSSIVRKAPNLGARDLLQECIEAAAPHGIPIIAYCQIQYDSTAWSQNPGWRMQDAARNEIKDRLCYRSPYLDYTKRVAAEMMKYRISGFHFDMLDFGFGPPYGCYCSRCRQAFQAAYGTDMPESPSWDSAWVSYLQFRCDSNSRFCNELSAFVKAGNPKLSVDFNYHGYPPFNWVPGENPVQHAMNGDFVTAEGLPWIFGHNNPSLLSLFMAGARPGGPIQGVTSRSVYNYHDFTVRPTAELTWEVMTYLAHGAQCTIVDKANYDGTLDPVCYQRIGRVFGEAIGKADAFGHDPLPEVGLYYSVRSRDWFGREDSAKYMEAFCGAHRALMQAHIPMGVLMDENVSAERLSAYPVVLLPQTAILTDRECELLEEYVHGGGNLVATGLTGLFARNGSLLGEMRLAKLFGVRLELVETHFPDNYLQLTGDTNSRVESVLAEDIPRHWPILVYGPVAAYDSDGADAFGQLLTAYRSEDNPWSRHMSPNRPFGPAIFVNSAGKGRTVLAPCAVDAAFIGRYRVPEHRNLLRNIVRLLNPSPAVRVSAPANVECVVTQDRSTTSLLVHFLSFSAPATAATPVFTSGRTVLPPCMEEPSWYEATLITNSTPASAAALSPATKLNVVGNRISLFTRAIHEVVRIVT
jgi:hypothetical protein